MDQINPFNYLQFFEGTGIFKELFEKSTNAWEVLPMIDDFIANFKNSSNFSEFTQVLENVYVGKNVSIDSDARIEGAAIICNNASIGHAAYLRGGVLIGENGHVGHATEVKHSVILDDSKLAHLNYIGDSVIGNNVNISGGATLANWRFDKKEVEVKFGDQRIGTGMEKFGSIIGDDSFVGVGAVLNPGSILGKNTIVYPLISVKGVHPSGATIK